MVSMRSEARGHPDVADRSVLRALSASSSSPRCRPSRTWVSERSADTPWAAKAVMIAVLRTRPDRAGCDQATPPAACSAPSENSPVTARRPSARPRRTLSSLATGTRVRRQMRPGRTQANPGPTLRPASPRRHPSVPSFRLSQRSRQVHTQALLPSGSASTTNDGAFLSSTIRPPAAIAAAMRASATSCGTHTSQWKR